MVNAARLLGMADILTGQSGETMTGAGQRGKRGLAVRPAGRYPGSGMA
ncbi:hypothetical protein [Ruegeria pomeroyi]|nr:hypothetical protein [Ruegeria pomeroyi]